MRTHPNGAGPDASRSTGPVSRAVAGALDAGGAGLERATGLVGLDRDRVAAERDELVALGLLLDLWLAPSTAVRGREHLQLDPRTVALKRLLEERFLARLEERCGATTRAGDRPDPDTRDHPGHADDPGQSDPGESAVAAVRRVAAEGLVPPVYRWVAERADLTELRRFLAAEGGPDAGFDDLVAMAQVGIRGVAKVALALNYWDELGGGSEDAVHTTMHRRMVDALELPRPDATSVPIGALERTALGGALATDRSRQPECLGALGLLELQAGPRCRAVVKALARLGAPAAAVAFYEEHAVADPRHGKDWLERVVAPLARSEPGWGPRIVRGARWRAEANRRLFDELGRAVPSDGRPDAAGRSVTP